MQSAAPSIQNMNMSSNENPSDNNEKDPAASSEMGRDPLSSIPDPSQIQPSKSPIDDRNNRAGGGLKVNTSGRDTTPAKTHSHRGSNGGPKRSFSRSRADRRVSLVDPDPALYEVPHFDLAHDRYFWERYNVQVLIRIRPLSDVEKVSQGYGRCLRQESGNTLAWTPHPETRFTFDHIACETISQEKLFTVAGLPMVDNCMSGYNSCMFAYGQTGSGKTYTMMGDISHVTESGKLSEDCGITPRIFEYLFTRIREEENKRRNEGLKYSCKCSFLEIYNEHITDLLEPSSNNLQLREDLKKGVYVENLTEYTVSTVDDVLRLLLQGAANRKMAATYMNSESSRSHSVFTCIVESRWEKDSMTHLRFGRLNLVDLAGSERQKSSGAEGDRLKEAATINKSLSTLGLVIMSLVDLAQGKQRHVPYRDSRLTFLLQDSLGGNSKTTIIANVSPSLCSANETLSTLKFAQRAKLIQNNAKVNEDASGDVMALQREIQQLKGRLSSLLHHGNSSENFLHPSTSFKELYLSGFREGVDSSVLSNPPDIRGGMQTGIGMKVEAANIRSDLVEDGTCLCDDGQRTEKALIFQGHDIQTELIHAKSLIEAMESNQICMMEELESLRKENDDLREILKDQGIGPGVVGESEISLQAKLEKLSKDLLETQLLNRGHLEDHAMELRHNQQTQVVQAEVEIAQLQSELHGRLHSLEEENESQRKRMEAKEAELKAVCCDWERATFELTAFLLDGSRSLKDASSQIENITSLFPRDNGWISEHVEKAAKLCVDKEESIRLLKSSLEDARSTVLEMEEKLNSLRGATIALAEVETSQNCEEIMHITHAGHKFTTQADSFFTGFEEVQGTMKEADCMLNALLKSNEDVKYWSSVWVQAGSFLRTQRDSLVEEIKQLNSSVQEREERNELLQDQMYIILKEISTIQQDGEELCKVACSDAILSVKEALNNVSCLRSLVEDVSSKVKKGGTVSSLLQHSFLIGDLNQGKRLDMNSDNFMSSLEQVAAAHSDKMVGTVSIDEEKSHIETVQRTDEVHDKNLELKRELERKNVVLKGLLFDISLLQESTSSKKYVKDEVDKLTETLNQVQKELKMKTNQLDDMLIQYAALEGCLSETENALVISNSNLEEVRLALDGLSEENSDLKILVKDLYQKKSEADQQLEEQAHAMEDLENEILRMATPAEENLVVSMKDTRNDMARVMIERDSLLDRIQSLENKLDIAYALTDEKEAIILEIRQESEASKEYAELKEEEVKILTHSVEELESTINVLEKKVYEMEGEVERHHDVRNSLEVEVQDMRERLLMVENMTEDMDSRSSRGELCNSKSSRKLHEGSTELWKAHNHIRNLEKEKGKLAKQIKQYKEYVSELVVHAEAQTSQYQQKYKNLELMVHEVRTDSCKVMNGAPDKSEKASAKPRGSSSPFRCISNLVQQMNLEKDQELSVSQLRIEELEALVASQQKEVSLLNTRLASVESMTHDVIRDLLGVKLDITNYSDLVSENRLQKLVEEAQQQAQQYITMEREIAGLRKQIQDLVEERESCAMEAGRREADGLATRVALEQIHERAQMLTAQNEMLKADKTNLQRRVAELDHTVRLLMQSVGLPETFPTRRNDRRSSSVGRLH